MPDPDWKTSAAEIEAIVSGRHGDPFAVLGPARGRERLGGAGLRSRGGRARGLHARRAGACADSNGVTRPASSRGTFLSGDVSPSSIARAMPAARWTVEDAYLLGPVLGPLDDYYIAEGNHLRLYDRLGAHPMQHEGHDGVHFAVWAPNASRVSVVGDFNGWDGRRHVMRKRRDTGVWEIFIPGAVEGQCYKYELLDA